MHSITVTGPPPKPADNIRRTPARCATRNSRAGARLAVARRAEELGQVGLLWAASGAALVTLIGCTSLAVGSVGGVVVGLLGGLMVAAGRPLLSR